MKQPWRRGGGGRARIRHPRTMVAVQSAKADFANFQRRIHSLRHGRGVSLHPFTPSVGASRHAESLRAFTLHCKVLRDIDPDAPGCPSSPSDHPRPNHGPRSWRTRALQLPISAWPGVRFRETESQHRTPGRAGLLRPDSRNPLWQKWMSRTGISGTIRVLVQGRKRGCTHLKPGLLVARSHPCTWRVPRRPNAGATAPHELHRPSSLLAEFSP
jgi:hypothetical protein